MRDWKLIEVRTVHPGTNRQHNVNVFVVPAIMRERTVRAGGTNTYKTATIFWPKFSQTFYISVADAVFEQGQVVNVKIETVTDLAHDGFKYGGNAELVAVEVEPGVWKPNRVPQM